jgi:hypothetical protein
MKVYWLLLLKQDFLHLVSDKTQLQSRVQRDNDFKCNVSSTQLRFEKISKLVQSQGSHFCISNCFSFMLFVILYYQPIN